MCITEYNEAETMRLFREEGREEGRKEGEDKLAKLITILISEGRIGDAQKAAVSEEERTKLYSEFQID